MPNTAGSILFLTLFLILNILLVWASRRARIFLFMRQTHRVRVAFEGDTVTINRAQTRKSPESHTRWNRTAGSHSGR
jgi:hypothetical protein